MNIYGRNFITDAFELVPVECRPDEDEVCRQFTESYKSEAFKLEEGYGFYPGFRRDTLDTYQPKSGDVLVASYAKTGTTWLREIVRQIIYIKDPILLEKTKKITQLYSYLGMGTPLKYQITNNLPIPRRVMGTHSPAPLLNFQKLRERDVKVLYVIRNPKDQAVSWYRFITKFDISRQPPLSSMLPQDEKQFYDFIIEGKQMFMSKEGEGYLEHVRDWVKFRSDPNVKIVVFEELKQDFSGQVRNIASFLGVDLDETDVEKIKINTSIDTMKEGASEHQKNFIQKGSVGSWKQHLTVAQSEQMDRKVEEILGDSGIEFIYELP